MKSLKAAAVVAGSMAVAGVAAPAFAADVAPPMSVNGGVNSAADQLTTQPLDVMPLQSQSRALDTENKDSALRTVNDATHALNSAGGLPGLLGGLPLQK